MITILSREFNDYLNSLVAYIVIGVFLTSVGLIMWVIPGTNVLDFGYATMEPVFTLGPYVFMFLIPAITMRSFAEEKRTGTIELLFTLPFRTWDIILGKYMAACLLVAFSLLPTLLYYYSLYQLGNPPGNLDTSGIIGSYIGLMLLGGIFVAAGILSSVISPNQIVAFVVAIIFCYIIYDGIALFELSSGADSWALFLNRISLRFHYNSLSRGLIALEDVAYLAGTAVLFLFATNLSLNLRR